MGRSPRVTIGGLAYHALNRANGRLPLFEKEGDFAAFEDVLSEAVKLFRMKLCAYCLMTNHWHLVLWPEVDGVLSQFMGWITLTHAQRWHAHHGTIGNGHLYQGRFKSFPIQNDEHFLTVCRYVERNALRAGLVQKAEDWRWSSLWRFTHGTQKQQSLLAEWPLPRPPDWIELVNIPFTDAEEHSLRVCAQRESPYGDNVWVREIANRLGLTGTLQPRGRPRKKVSGTFFEGS